MSLVLDASLTLAWYFDDESTATTDAVMDQVAQAGAIVPALWRYEVANGFQSAIRRKRVDAAYRDASLAELRLLPIAVDRISDDAAWSATLGFADRFLLTAYDAAYLELAHRRAVPLATKDRALAAAARAMTIDVIDAAQ